MAKRTQPEDSAWSEYASEIATNLRRLRQEAGLTGSDAVSRFASLRTSKNVDARVMGSAIDLELMLGYEGNTESGLLRDPALREWRDQNRELIEDALACLNEEASDLAPEPESEIERELLRAFGIDEQLNNA